jgi:hypothetical protein
MTIPLDCKTPVLTVTSGCGVPFAGIQFNNYYTVLWRILCKSVWVT